MTNSKLQSKKTDPYKWLWFLAFPILLVGGYYYIKIQKPTLYFARTPIYTSPPVLTIDFTKRNQIDTSDVNQIILTNLELDTLKLSKGTLGYQLVKEMKRGKPLTISLTQTKKIKELNSIFEFDSQTTLTFSLENYNILDKKKFTKFLVLLYPEKYIKWKFTFHNTITKGIQNKKIKIKLK